MAKEDIISSIMSEGTQRWTEQLKACGQSIIDNAEKLADIGKYQTELKVIISISGHNMPVIAANTEWIPERWVDDHNIEKELQQISEMPESVKTINIPVEIEAKAVSEATRDSLQEALTSCRNSSRQRK